MKPAHLGIALMIAAMLSFSVQDGLSRYLAETYNTPMVVAFRYWVFAVYVMILAATIGSVIGALVLYYIAAAIGPERLRHFVVRFGKWFGVKESDLTKAEAWFDRRSTAAVLAGRCVPLIRSIVSIPAGFRRMKIVPFIAYTFAGSAVWNIVLIGAGAILGDNWDAVADYISIFQYLVIAGILLLLVRFAFTIIKRRKG